MEFRKDKADDDVFEKKQKELRLLVVVSVFTENCACALWSVTRIPLLIRLPHRPASSVGACGLFSSGGAILGIDVFIEESFIPFSVAC